MDSSTALRPSTSSPSTGDLLARPHAKAIADRDRVERDILVRAVRADAPRGLGREIEQRADRAAGLFARPQLQHLSEQDERR